ncbi:hypothetical protein N9L06_05315 [Mariniblastus sp.]|nr:hypothetical protein [Mariniblastus sp.]
MNAHKKGPELAGITGTSSEESIQAESLLLKSLFKVPAIFNELGETIQPAHFGHLGYGRLFGAMRSGYRDHGKILFGRSIFALRAGSGMNTAPSPDGCRFEMIRLLAGFVAWWHWPYYAKRVRESAYRRVIIETAEQNAAEAMAGLPLAELEANRTTRRMKLEALTHG